MKLTTAEQILKHIIKQGNCAGISCVPLSHIDSNQFNSIKCPLNDNISNQCGDVVIRAKEMLESIEKLKFLEKL